MGEKKFYFFAKFVLGYDWLVPHVHKPLCDILEDYTVHRRVKVTLPRSWLKSTVCSISYPIWRSCRDSMIRVLLVQNTADNARGKLRSIRGQWEKNALLRLLYSHLLPDKNARWTTSALCLKREKEENEATYEAAGCNTQVVGRHYNIIIEDDTVAPDKDEYTEDNVLPTKDDVGQAIGWHRAASPLLVNFQVDQIIVVGTRWFELDLLSWIGMKEKWYTSYERAVKETDGKPDSNGALSWPERFPQSALDELEQSIGPYLFSCLYLNHPMRSEDMTFQPKWIRYYDTEPAHLDKYIAVDPAGNPKNSVAKGKKKNDFNVVMVLGKNLSDGRCYVLDYVQFKGGPGELIDELFRLEAEHNPKMVGIEAIAYQESLDHWVKEEMKKRKRFFNLKLIKHSGSKGSSKKEYRIRNLQPLVRAGMIAFRGWMNELLSEMMVFPLGANDDLIDTLSMFLQLLDITVGAVAEIAQLNSTEIGLEQAIRELAQAHRPPTGSYLDVMFRGSEGSTQFDPYSYLDSEGLAGNPSMN